jgi:Stage II sporulation protein E (SpoIIE)/PDZ domain
MGLFSATLPMIFRKILVLAITLFQVVLFAGLIGWRVMEWTEVGWAGLAYQVDREAETEERQAPFFWGRDSRRVEMVVPGGPADQAGITVGELVESVDGIDIADSRELKNLADRVRVGDELRYEIRSEIGSREVVLHLENPYRLPVVVAATATSVIVGAVFLLISMLVYWSRSRSQVALVFFLMCVFGAAEYLVWAVVEFDLPTLRGVAPAVVEPFMFVGLAFVGFFAVVLMNTLLHLSLIFPRARPVVERWPQVLVWIHCIPFVMAAVVLVLVASAVASRGWGTLGVAAVAVIGLGAGVVYLRRWAMDDGWWSAIRSHPWTVLGLVVLAAAPVGIAVRLFPPIVGGVVVGIGFGLTFFIGMASILVYSVLIVVTLYRSYRESGVDEKRQVRWPLWGTATAVGSSIVIMALSLAFSFLFGSAGQIDFTTNAVLTAASKIIYPLIPISLAFGILKYRLMEIDVIIRKTVVYSGVTGFILVVYLLLAGASGLALLRSAGIESQTATVVATLTVVALFVPMRNWIQRLVDRVFFRRERDSEASIRQITATVMNAASVEALALGVAEEVQRALHCRSVAILTRSTGGGRLSTAATVGLPDGLVSKLVVTDPDGLPGDGSIRTGADLASLSGEAEDLARRSRAERAIVCSRGDTVVGLIIVGRKLSKDPFDDEDEVFLETVAGQVVVGLGRLRGRRAELEFAQALQIQRSLLPAEIPQIDGVEVVARWQPAREVSGDYYDVLRLDDHRLAVCIGDVVGKGMPAALLMSSLQAAVKAVATNDAEPMAVCTQVRSVVASNLQGGKFVTFFFAIVDGASKRLTFTNCGHNPPVLVRSDGTVLRLSEGGPAFARLMRELPYVQQQVTFDLGDRLVLFTDGVSEAEDAVGEQFSEERLESIAVENRRASASELERILTEAVVEHADGELQDDLTMVVLAVDYARLT